GTSVEELLKSKQFEVVQGTSPSSESRTFTGRFPTLDIPTRAADRPTQILVVLQLQLVASTVGEWEIGVSVRPASHTDFQHDLPRVRIAAVEQTWLPVVSGFNPKRRTVARALRAATGRDVEQNARPTVREGAYRQDGSRVQLGPQSRRLLQVSGHIDRRHEGSYRRFRGSPSCAAGMAQPVGLPCSITRTTTIEPSTKSTVC